MTKISVLFVDDEVDIRQSFEDRFEDQFSVHLASNGDEALEFFQRENSVNVVVTDIRMPSMDGLELIKKAKDVDPDMGFIVVSGHGDTDDVIAALRLGARNFIRKPYSFAELEEAIILESRRYQLILEERARLEDERTTEKFLTSLDNINFSLPSKLEWVNPITFRLVGVMEAVGLCDPSNRSNIALGLMEIITNSIEHGNLEFSSEEKREIMTKGEQHYLNYVAKRAEQEPYKGRKVEINATINSDMATIRIKDDGNGFDYHNLPDPTDPENLFMPSGRGIMLASSFIDEVNYSGKGNVVTLVHYKNHPS